MQCLVYASSATRELSDDTLREILEISQRNNAAAGVTGMLMYANGNILQALEGEASAVEGLYARIERDPRHRGVLRLVSFELAARQFPEWSMGLRRPIDLPPDDGAVGLRLMERSLDEPLTAGLRQEVRVFLETFARRMR